MTKKTIEAVKEYGEWIAYCKEETDGEPQPHGRGKTKDEAIADYIDGYGDEIDE